MWRGESPASEVRRLMLNSAKSKLYDLGQVTLPPCAAGSSSMKEE